MAIALPMPSRRQNASRVIRELIWLVAVVVYRRITSRVGEDQVARAVPDGAKPKEGKLCGSHHNLDKRLPAVLVAGWIGEVFRAPVKFAAEGMPWGKKKS